LRHDPPRPYQHGFKGRDCCVVAGGLGLLELTGEAPRDRQGGGRVVGRVWHGFSLLQRIPLGAAFRRRAISVFSAS
jgi:hypothetical protein